MEKEGEERNQKWRQARIFSVPNEGGRAFRAPEEGEDFSNPFLSEPVLGKRKVRKGVIVLQK